MSNFYIADCHFGHANVINFDSRPFTSVKEMDAIMIENWQKAVTKRDTVYILGDFIWSKENEWMSILRQLPGNKFLIRGNHDPKQFSAEVENCFCQIVEKKIISDCGRTVIMNHCAEPYYINDHKDNVFMLYGHVHMSKEYEQLLLLKKHIKDTCIEKFHNKGNFINVGCMTPWMSYCPRTLDEIIEGEKEYFENLFIGSN